MLLHAHEQLGSAEVCYKSAHALEPGAFSWAYLIAVTQAEAGDQATASLWLRRALAIDPEYLPARERLADALMRSGNVEGSRDEYRRLAREFPEFAAAHYGLGRTSSLRGETGAAIPHYQRAVELAPQFGAGHYALALAYRDTGMHDLAQTHMQHYRRWGASRPALPDPLLDRVRSMKATARDLLVEAARLGEAGQLEEAVALHVKALERDPAAAQAHVNLISLYGRLGRPEQAQDHYRAALTLGSNLADAHYNYGVLLTAVDRAHAARLFRLALDVHPFHAQAHNNLATLLAGQGRLDDAAAHYRQAIASDPGHRAARFNLGRTLMGLGRPADAAVQFQHLIQRDDNDHPRFLFALATALFAADDRAKAIEYAEQALREARARRQIELSAAIDAALHKMKERR
jgi:tetratricopeptide (TPR) repeat protein